MLALMLKSALNNKPQAEWLSALVLLLLSVCALGSIVLGVFLLAGPWGFIALGVALVLLEWRIDAQ